MEAERSRSGKFRRILGIDFFVGPLDPLIEECRNGGLVVVPSGPGLADLPRNPKYRESLESASFAITDSSYLVIVWFLRTGEVLKRNSGLQLIRAIVEKPFFKKSRDTFWVMPSKEDSDANVAWLRSRGLEITDDYRYVAAHYAPDHIEDPALLERIEKLKPGFVIINIGGGTQEVLGHYLSSRLSYRPTILCTGAAIAFLSGRQANIPPWTDKMMIAWFVRCLSEPRRFIPRYLRAFRLIAVVFKYARGSVAPVRA